VVQIAEGYSIERALLLAYLRLVPHAMNRLAFTIVPGCGVQKSRELLAASCQRGVRGEDGAEPRARIGRSAHAQIGLEVPDSNGFPKLICTILHVTRDQCFF
jgi:hypothetical protein